MVYVRLEFRDNFVFVVGSFTVWSVALCIQPSLPK
jgi:hypothetical protein